MIFLYECRPSSLNVAAESTLQKSAVNYLLEFAKPEAGQLCAFQELTKVMESNTFHYKSHCFRSSARSTANQILLLLINISLINKSAELLTAKRDILL